MLEKIGLPAKPSLRGNNWVVDATHCQGCSSQFTFINRKHHCRRCGGLFCGCCTQQRMYLRGQGDSPVRICDPCKTLEEAARFEMRHGHKNKSGRGTSKLASNNEDDVLNKILADGGNESVPSDQDSVDFLSSVERATSSASTSNSNMGSTSPEELRLQAVEEKKKYKTLKAEGKPEEALRAFKRGKELERQAGALEIKLRKNRRKALSSTMINENKKIEDAKRPKEKDDLANELRELGWSDLDLRDADRKPATMTLEGELSTLLKEASQKTNSNTEKGNVSIDKSEVVALKKRALTLKREGKLTEAKEELKRAKILEKQIEERELLGDSDDSDDGFSSLIRSMDIDKEDISATGNNWKRNVDFDYLLRMDDGVGIDSNFEVTDEDLDDPEMSAALQSLGWTEDTSQPTPDRGAILSEIQSLKRDALSKKRAGGTAEALALLRKAKALEADIGNDDDTEESGCLVNSSVSSTSKPDVDYKMPPKSKLAIQRELLLLKKKALALRREGRVDEADQELMKGKALEQQLEELEKGPKVKSAQVNVNERVAEFSAPMDVEDEGEDVTDTDMNDPSYLSLLQNLGWQDEDNEKGQVVELEAPKQETVSSRKSKAEIQRELLGLKRKSLALRRQGNIDEAEEVLKMSKGLEAQLAEMEAPKQEMNVDETYGASSLKIAGEKTVVSEVPLDEKPETGIKEEVVAVKSVGERKVVSEVSFDEKPQIGNKEELVGVNESSSIKQEILALKRKAVSLKREGKLAEAKEELRHAKLLEKKIMDIEEKSSVSGMSKLNSSDIVATVGTKDQNDSPAPKLPMKSNSNSSDVTPIGKKDQHEISPPKLSSRDRFKLQQESLSHKRQALKLRREGRTAEAEAEFELAKNLESQLEELNAAQESSKPEGLVDDVGIEDLLDPQLLSALREIGIEGTAGGLSQYPEKAEPVKHQQAVNKTENSNEERMQLEEQIKAEKVKAVNLKRSGKQAEALDALRRAKLFEKKLNSLASS